MKRPRWTPHPLVAAFVALWLSQTVGLLLFNFGTDSTGQALQVSPLNALMLAIPYYSCWVCVIATVFFAAWRFFERERPIITTLGVTLSLVLILLTQVDFGMQRFRGERLRLMHLRMYLTPNVVNSDWLAPVTQDPKYLASTLAVWIGGSALLILLVTRYRRVQADRGMGPTWATTLRCAVGALVCYAPLAAAWYHQRDMVLPPEALLLGEITHPQRPLTPAEEATYRELLRHAVDPGGTSHWLTDQYPLMRLPPREADTAKVSDPPDIIMFVVESLRGHDVGYGMNPRPPGQSPTPHLDSLARESVVFPRYIANGEPTPRGFITINTGQWEHQWGFIVANFPNLHMDALPARLRLHGYHTLAMWGDNPSFDNELVWARRWYDERIFDMPGNSLFYFKTMPDRVLMDRFIDRVKAHDATAPHQPLFAYVKSNGTHTPYDLEAGAAVPADSAPSTSRQRRYDLVLRNVDAQIGSTLHFLESRPRWKNTIIIVIGDHSDRTEEALDERWRGMPVDPVVWTAALIHGPARFVGPPRREDEMVASHVDLMPTVLHWLRDDGVTSSVGHDLFTETRYDERTAVAVNSRGYRIDRGRFSLLVDSRDPQLHYAWRAFSGDTPALLPLEKTPFAWDEPARLTTLLSYWSLLVQQDRVWSDSIARYTPRR